GLLGLKLAVLPEGFDGLVLLLLVEIGVPQRVVHSPRLGIQRRRLLERRGGGRPLALERELPAAGELHVPVAGGNLADPLPTTPRLLFLTLPVREHRLAQAP